MESDKAHNTYLNSTEAAEFLGVPQRTLQEWAKAGNIPSLMLAGKGNGMRRFKKSDLVSFKNGKKSIELQHLLEVTCNGNRTQAARILGISHAELYRRINKLGIGPKVKMIGAELVAPPIGPVKWCSIADAAKFLGVSEGTLYCWRAGGKGPPFVRKGKKQNSRIFYRESILIKFREEHEATTVKR